MAASKKQIEIPAVEWARMPLRIVGLSPLIVKNFDEKTKQMMADAQAGKARNRKEPKVPKEHYERARLRDAKGCDCVRSLWIKCACIDAARFVEGVKMTELRGALFIEGDMLPINYKTLRMRTDSVRVGMGTADLAYRPEYTEWSVDIVARYRPNMLTDASVVNLLNNAGESIGLCERRPGQNGDQFGRFEVQIGRAKKRKAA